MRPPSVGRYARISDRDGQPCLWLDVATRRCRHYEHRPGTCRDFRPGSYSCLQWRHRFGIPGPQPDLTPGQATAVERGDRIYDEALDPVDAIAGEQHPIVAAE